MKNTEQNLTVGSVPKQLLKFTVPLLFANLLQAFYNITDMVIVGRFVGSIGLAAVSNASILCFIITSVGMGVTIGGTVIVAQSRGAGDRQGEQETVGTLFTMMALIALPVTVASILMCKQIFVWMGVPGEALSEASEYMCVLSGGTIFVFDYNAACALLRGLGDSRRPLLFVAIASAINIILDLIMVGALQMGTAGAAWSTVAAQGIAAAVALGYLRRFGLLRNFRWRSFAIKPDKAASILKTGIPSAVQMLVTNLAFMMVTAMFNRYGVVATAAAGVGLKISTLAGMPCWAVGQAVTAMSAQNLGAGKIGRTAETALAGLRLSLFGTMAAIIPIQLFAGPVIGLFDSNPEVIRAGVVYLRIFCSFSGLAYAVMFTCDAFATGTGAALLALINALLEAVVLRLLLCWLLGFALGYGFAGTCWGMALSTIPPALIGLAYYRWAGWRNTGSERRSYW